MERIEDVVDLGTATEETKGPIGVGGDERCVAGQTVSPPTNLKAARGSRRAPLVTMGYRFRPGLFACCTGGTIVLLDV